MDPDTPKFREAISGPHREEFLDAMRKEIEVLESLGTWKVVKKGDVPENTNVIPTTWAFKIKRYPDGRLRKYKARFCVRGDKQKEGVDYDEKYAPVVSWSTVRMLMRLALKEDWKTRQVDFQNAFAQAPLKENVYIKLPPMFDGEDSSDIVLKLNKSLYGLVQAPLTWYDYLKMEFANQEFIPSEIDPCLFYGKDMMAMVYVEDVVFFGKDLSKIDKTIEGFKSNGYALTKEENLFHFLGVDITQNEKTGKVTLKQLGLINKILKYVDMEDCNTKETPAMKTPLCTDAGGEPFNEKWEYARVVGIAFTA